jgi:uncharacterized membrane protein (DUF485 family)
LPDDKQIIDIVAAAWTVIFLVMYARFMINCAYNNGVLYGVDIYPRIMLQDPVPDGGIG